MASQARLELGAHKGTFAARIEVVGIGCDRLGLGEGDHRLSQAGRQAIPGYRSLAGRLSQAIPT